MKRVLLAIVIFTLFFGAVRVMQHYTFTNNAFDDGFNDNLIWNTLHGNFMYSDIKGYATLGDHLELATLLFIPFYLIGLGPWILYLGQTLVIALGALPVYWLARERIKDESFHFLLPLAYLLYVPTVNITFQGYYPIALAITPLLFASYYLIKDKYLPFALWLLLACLAQENIYLVAAFFGLYILIFKKQKIFGGLLCLLGLAVFFLALTVIIPHFNSHGEFIYYGRFAYLGRSAPEMIATLCLRPWTVIPHAVTPDKIWYLLGLFWPLAFLSLRAPAFLLPALPILGQNLLTTYREMYQLGSRYPSAIVPFVFVSAIFGLERLLAQGKRTEGIRKTMAVFMVLSLAYFFLGFFVRYTAVTPPVREGHEILKLIPADTSISALGNLYPHLCHRKNIWLFPKNWQRADYIILCKLDPTWPLTGSYGPALKKLAAEKNYGKILEYIFVGETPLPGPLSKREYPAVYEEITASRAFRTVKEGRYYLLLKRDLLS
ncbi:MAG: DUF2079 domain-containing protein [Candidatus Saganbacteria bacterium]|nr:DUF2079 domain-containing protein [Candidatus Saganbacteria bacterium]